ncbi:MAG: hypothetical protein JNL11_09230 [Bdellovibrionaceae bacterium]|nr:hypothetical protein [Pseudobdellovibrionaceae bacterium]
MSSGLKLALILVLCLPVVGFSKISRKPLSETPTTPFKSMEDAIQKVDADLWQASDVTLNQKGFFASVSYSLFSPTFDADILKSQNQESLGLSAAIGYSYCPQAGLGVQTSLGVLQNSKTDRSLPDFILLKPAVSALYSVSKSLYVTGGVFNYYQQGQNLKNFQSYIGQEYFVGYKANKKINIKFGFSFSKFSGDFSYGSESINSLVSIRGLESQLVYLF